MKIIVILVLTCFHLDGVAQEALLLNLLPADSQNTSIFWLGEAHGTSTNYDVAYEYVAQLVSEQGLDYLLTEQTYLNELLSNKYLETGDESLLDSLLENSKNTFSYSQENRAYFQKLYKLNANLPESERFRYVSVDIEHSLVESFDYVERIIKETDHGATYIKQR